MVETPPLPPLPIDDALPDLRTALATRACCVLVAAPGAGKTTRVPPALLEEPWLDGGRILMLEPRRLAARAAARRMAFERGEAVGGLFGYRVRQDSKLSTRTRVEVVTEGILTRRLQGDPGLDGVGCVILDEFHERSLNTDLALALLREVQGVLRPDLRILVMSATLDAATVSALLDNAPVVDSPGRVFPVAVRHLPRPERRALPEAMARTIGDALIEESGSLLAFLPGEREIRATQSALSGRLPPGVVIRPLFGALTPTEQDAAIAPCPSGERKVVLATDIAETSLTIEGIRVVVDAGLRRTPRFDPNTGLSRLETIRVSQAGAEQRRGRAGRLEPGLCLRLWPEPEHRALPPHETPEILTADLAPLALDLAVWGTRDAGEMAWLSPPPAGPLAQARDLLAGLGAVDEQGAITAHGRAMATLPLHPRLAHMVLAAEGDDARAGATGGARGGILSAALARTLAALLEERDILKGGRRDADLRTRVEHFARGGRPGPELDPGGFHRVRDAIAQLARLRRAPSDGSLVPMDTGRILARAYPDRVAQARSGAPGRFLLANGRGALLDPADPLAASPFLVVADMDGAGTEGRIRLAAPLDRADLDTLFQGVLHPRETISWDPRTEALTARLERRLGALVLESRDLPPGNWSARAVPAVREGIRRLGLQVLPWSKETDRLRERVTFLHHVLPGEDWPDQSDGALLDGLADWLDPYLSGITRRSHFTRLDLLGALKTQIGWERLGEMETLAPPHMTVPSGQAVPLDYGAEDGPVLAARVQQLFGLTETPKVARGTRPVLIHLLSPAGRPLQVTRDLAGFWKTSYADVRKDMRGRYPKHPWPEDPTLADATNRTKPKGK
ncbi:MAG: ATP-dependent helicase HrpB [Rhodospirillum sp.]|nr:ATP-dependent helicase HrpB [Rhodospirillum sp.]MCF8489750.1 ATP-dependent helicase HrpB [Rhodospirillum sp.]